MVKIAFVLNTDEVKMRGKDTTVSFPKSFNSSSFPSPAKCSKFFFYTLFCFSLLPLCQIYISVCSCQLLNNLKLTLPVPEVRVWHHSGTTVNDAFSVKVPEAVLIWLCVVGSKRRHRSCDTSLCRSLALIVIRILSQTLVQFFWMPAS